MCHPFHAIQTWHSWAKANARLADSALALAKKSQRRSGPTTTPTDCAAASATAAEQAEASDVPAVRDSLRCIALGMGPISKVSGGGGGSVSTPGLSGGAAAVVLQDTLRFLTLWIAHGARPAVQAVGGGRCDLGVTIDFSPCCLP